MLPTHTHTFIHSQCPNKKLSPTLPNMEETLAAYARAMALRPAEKADLYSDLGSALSRLGHAQTAAQAYGQAIRLVPQHAIAYNNLAALLGSTASGRAEALRLYLTARALQPAQYERYPQMHLNLAGVLVDAARYDEAVWHYAQGLKYKAHREDTLGRLVHLSQRVCNWRRVDWAWPSLRHDLSLVLRRAHRRAPGDRPALSPMHALTLPISASELSGLARAHATAVGADASAQHLFVHHARVPPRLGSFIHDGSVRTDGIERSGGGIGSGVPGGGAGRPRPQLRVGLMSSDFKRHPVTILLAPALSSVPLGRRDVHWTLFPLTRFADASPSASPSNFSSDAWWQAQLRAAVDRVVPLQGANGTADAVARVRAARPHVLIDLNGLYSRGAQPLLVAARPAPLQATHLGYGGTTGAAFVDYTVADRRALPPSRAQSQLYTERHVLLPHSHLPAGHPALYPHGAVACRGGAAARPGPQGRRGADGSIPTQGVTFGFFGQHLKIDEPTYTRWLSAVRMVPHSALWLLEWPSSTAWLRSEAAAAGVDTRRLVFVEKRPQGDHLCLFGLVDVALDSPSYASGATGIDVLWSRAPMVAMAGAMRAGRGSSASRTGHSNIFQRNGVSLLHAAATPAAEAHSSMGYVDLARQLAEQG